MAETRFDKHHPLSGIRRSGTRKAPDVFTCKGLPTSRTTSPYRAARAPSATKGCDHRCHVRRARVEAALHLRTGTRERQEGKGDKWDAPVR